LSHHRCREYQCGFEKLVFQNPLRIPHEVASSWLVSDKCGYPRQRRDNPAMQQSKTRIKMLCALSNSSTMVVFRIIL